jgi:hypothetical protein
MQAPSPTIETQPPMTVLESPEGDQPLLSVRQAEQWTLAFVILGLAARCLRYILKFPLWEDETFLCANLIDRDYVDLLNPLNYHQVAPVCFLWIQLTVVKLLGFHELSLRLVPFLVSIGSLILFWRLAKRCLTGLPQVLAVAVFSVTYATIRYSAEAKPYGLDLFVALVLVSLLVNWLQDPQRTRWLWALVAFLPVAICLSYGAILLSGGLGLTVAWVVWRQRRWDCLWPTALGAVAFLASVALQYALSMRAQMGHELEGMRFDWREHFPPLHDVGALLYWMLHTHCGDILAYPAGGSPFYSTFSFICWLTALIVLGRKRQWTFLLLGLAPLVVSFLAAAVRRYPYGGNIRINLYMAPFMCMMIGYGWSVLAVWCRARGSRPALCFRLPVVILAAVGTYSMARDLSGPYKTTSDQRARAFAQWFWFNLSENSEVVCTKADLHQEFAPETYKGMNFSAQYLCNMAIYSPRHAAHESVHWERLSTSHPLRCVLFRVHNLPVPKDKLDAWLERMKETYDLVGQDTYPMVRQNRINETCAVDYIDIFRFVPKATSSTPQARRRACGLDSY